MSAGMAMPSRRTPQGASAVASGGGGCPRAGPRPDGRRPARPGHGRWSRPASAGPGRRWRPAGFARPGAGPASPNDPPGFDPLVARKPGQIFLGRAGRRELGRQPADAHIVPGHDAILHPLHPATGAECPGRPGSALRSVVVSTSAARSSAASSLGSSAAQAQAEFDMAAAGLAGDRIGGGVEPQFAAGQCRMRSLSCSAV